MQKYLQVTEPVVDSQVVERILRSEIASLGPIVRVHPLAATPGVAAFGADVEGGQSFFLKLCDGAGQDAFDVEAYQLGYLAAKSPLPVPKVLSLSKDGKTFPFTYLLLGGVQGVPWSRLDPSTSGREREEVERDLAGLLGRMHAEVTASRFGEVLPDPSPSYGSWPELLSALWAGRLDEVMVADRLDSPTQDAVGWIHKNLNHLVATSEPPRLVHGNFSPARVLCNPEGGKWKVSGVLEPALLYGHPEIDLAFLEFLCGVGKSFYECYTRHLAIPEGFDLRKYVYMLYFALEDVRLYGNTHHILAAVEYAREVLRRCGC